MVGDSGALPRAAGPHTARDDQVDEEAGAEEERQAEQAEEGDDARGKGYGMALQRHREVMNDELRRRRHRMQQCDRPHDDERGDGDGLDHRFVVSLSHVRPQPLVLAEGSEHRDRDWDDPGDRRPQ